MKKLTEEQAWKVLQVVFKDRFGFCTALECLKGVGLISNPVRWRMTERFSKLPHIPAEKNGGEWYYKFPVTLVEKDKTRVLFAERQADLSRRRKKR